MGCTGNWKIAILCWPSFILRLISSENLAKKLVWLREEEGAFKVATGGDRPPLGSGTNLCLGLSVF